jgi:hypothetical protein
MATELYGECSLFSGPHPAIPQQYHLDACVINHELLGVMLDYVEILFRTSECRTCPSTMTLKVDHKKHHYSIVWDIMDNHIKIERVGKRKRNNIDMFGGLADAIRTFAISGLRVIIHKLKHGKMTLPHHIHASKTDGASMTVECK